MSFRLRDILDPYADPMGECPAVEVFRFRDKNGYFGQSPEPRDVRPPHIKYRVGQVVKHKRYCCLDNNIRIVVILNYYSDGVTEV